MKEKTLYENNFYKDEDEIDLKELVFVLLRRWKLIVVFGIIGGIIGSCFAVTRPNVYKAEMLMIVSKDGDFGTSSLNEGELSVNRKLAATYTEIAKNSVILKNIIKKYELNITLKELKNDVTISSIGNTELLRLTYTNSDPVLAAAVANEIGNEFMLKIREIMNFKNIKVVELAEVEKDALPQNRALIVLISLGVSVIVGCIIVSIIEIISGKLYKVKDIEKILRTSMIGSIPTLNDCFVGGEEDGK
ncbi:YveK family protein [Cetobacterium somerae]|uniref:YveK family protein n=1 Tax=Cetobacterium somerae TaxID=188913 RepID=UPI00248DD9B2|nr:Wzz/FepE/Etk N-terminal domain-containing protein [Cetobacterium somerae]